MQKAIVAIGGGDLTAAGTTAIDREIIRLSGRKHPTALFVPTASADSETYARRFVDHFGGFLKCKTEVLRLVHDAPARREIVARIFSADIIYVGGGNTLAMMRLWRRLGVDRLLRTAYDQGIVLSGISAGAICWFDSGHSDSMSFYDPQNWKYINVKGLGLLRGIHCPHYNGVTRGVPRRRNFQEMIRRIGGTGIAIENHCAIEFLDGRLYRVIPAKPNARAYRVRRSGEVVIAEEIRRQQGWAPIDGLYAAEKSRRSG
jgi:dipeptidase E